MSSNTKKNLFIKKSSVKIQPRENFLLLSLDKVRAKRRAYKTWKKYRTTHNYNIYAKFRNQVKWEVKKAKKFKEIEIAKDAKVNPKGFFKYVNSKIKPKEGIGN